MILANSWSLKTDAYLRHAEVVCDSHLQGVDTPVAQRLMAEALAWLALVEAWRCLLSELSEYYSQKRPVIRGLEELRALQGQSPEFETLKTLAASPYSWVAELELRTREPGTGAPKGRACAGEHLDTGQAGERIQLVDADADQQTLSAAQHIASIRQAMASFVAEIRQRQEEW